MSPFPRSPRTAIGLGLLLHLAYLLAMFDTYFHSPIVQVEKSHSIDTKDHLADRLVLLVADGLRADLVFTPSGSPRIPLQEGEIMAPHLRSIISNRGCFGLSHARVPTESRPGHVALIGGLWEDPSAVFKGWKHNPVNFDSVLNQSSTSFTFGSPDILPIFGDSPTDGKREDDPLDPTRKVLMWMYHEEDEDFTSDATRLDHFSFNKFSAVLQQGREDAALDRRLRAPGTVFFLHLLGLDTTGHGYGPHSPEYIANIQVVDEIVRKVEREMQDYFADDRTAFLFTADHGMSNIGNHGDGHPDSTRTPFVAWGSGVRGPVSDPDSSSHDEVSRPWRFDHLVRRDVDQVDLTMLMAALSGTSWPKNSVGILPDDLLKPVSDSKHVQADLMLGNARSILEQFGTKHRRTSARKLFFRPFTKLLNLYGEDAFGRVHSMIERGDFRAAAIESRTIAGLALEGLTYYDTYDQARLRNIVSLGYLSFSIYTLLYVRHAFGTSTPSKIIPMKTLPLDAVSIGLGVLVLAGAAVERSPWHALYAAFPIYLVRAIIITLWETSSGAELRSLAVGTVVKRVGQLGGFSLALIAMALGYQHRLIWSLGFIPLALLLRGNRSSDRNQALARSLPVVSAAVWALFPVERDESLPILVMGGLINYAFTALCFRKSYSTADPAWKAAQRTFGVQLYFQGALSVYAIWAAYSLSQKWSLGPMTRGAGWILLAYSIVFPLASGFKAGQSANLRLALLYNTFSGSYLLLSQSWEILFLINYAVIVAIWMNVQRSADPVEPSKSFRRIKSSDASRALAFLFLVHAGFFCTGNVASISSFYLGPVYRLIPVFQPAIMSTLLMYKIIVPFILLSAAFASICSSQCLPPFALILLTLAMSEPICLFFFRQVKTTGSWLEIGSSISHFAIASLLIAYNVFLYLIGDYVMQGTAPLIPAERPKVD